MNRHPEEGQAQGVVECDTLTMPRRGDLPLFKGGGERLVSVSAKHYNQWWIATELHDKYRVSVTTSNAIPRNDEMSYMLCHPERMRRISQSVGPATVTEALRSLASLKMTWSRSVILNKVKNLLAVSTPCALTLVGFEEMLRYAQHDNCQNKNLPSRNPLGRYRISKAVKD